MSKRSSVPPNHELFERTVQRLLMERGEEIEFLVLFGSIARGDWSWRSDYDLLLGLRGEDGMRFVDRLLAFAPWIEGNIDLFPYSRSEWERMFAGRHPLLLEALDHGVVLWDRGAFTQMREIFQGWKARGEVEHLPSGWRIRDPAG
ncbi:MAG: nucleotidyltransferase domain-containing protein [Thermoflexus sp.]